MGRGRAGRHDGDRRGPRHVAQAVHAARSTNASNLVYPYLRARPWGEWPLALETQNDYLDSGTIPAQAGEPSDTA